MLGYVVAEKAELKMREFEVYNAYYCGVCKSVGRRFGQLPRLTLNYDFAFLALMLASLSDEEDCIHREHCIIHPVKKKNIILDNSSVDYAADMMLILVYYNLRDDVQDEKKLSSRALAALFHNNYKKLAGQYSKICETVENQLVWLSKLEGERCGNLDQMGEAFAVIMGELFAGGLPDENKDDLSSKALQHLGKFMGKWIYLADAWDDLEKDIKNEVYNPLIYRFEYDRGDIQKFRDKIRAQIEFSMLSCLAEISKACDLLNIKKHKGIVENIIYFGLLRKTEQLMKKGTEENEGSI